MAKRKAEEMLSLEIPAIAKKSRQLDGENLGDSVESIDGASCGLDSDDDKDQIEYIYTITCHDTEEQIVEDDVVEDDVVEDDVVEDSVVDDDVVEDEVIEDLVVEDQDVEDQVEEDQVEEDQVEEDQAIEDQAIEDHVEEDQAIEDHVEEDQIEDQSELEVNEMLYTVIQPEVDEGNESSDKIFEAPLSYNASEYTENDHVHIVLNPMIAKLEKEEEEIEEYEDAIELKIQQLEISLPLLSVKEILISNGLISESCANIEYWLQDSEPLDPTKGLDQYCVESTGQVQVNLEVKTTRNGAKSRINVTDILVPCDNVLPARIEPTRRAIQQPKRRPRPPKGRIIAPESSNIASWVVDQEFREIQHQTSMPAEINLWNSEEVRHWLRWARNHFPFQELDIDNCELTGADVCKWTNEDVQTLVPNDSDNLFWTHLQLLIKCNIAALQVESNVQREIDFGVKPVPKISSGRGNRSGNNGQIQLWQFLLEILIDQSHRDIVEWVGIDGTFRLKNPECVARLWGFKKNKEGMTYDKMSRAMRYYYEGDMIRKASGSRFTYKFVCDLRSMIGFSVAEIQNLVNSPTAAIESAEDTQLDQQRLANLLETLKMPGCIRRGVPPVSFVTVEEPESLIIDGSS